MNSALLFGLLLTLVVVFIGVSVVKDFGGFKTHPKFKNVPGGIIMVLSVAVIFAALAFCSNQSQAGEGSYFNYLEMFVGVDYDKESLFCRKPAPLIVEDDHWTSNVGFRGNIYRSGDRKLEVNAKYQHHSCAFNQDKPTYNAAGIEITYRIGD